MENWLANTIENGSLLFGVVVIVLTLVMLYIEECIRLYDQEQAEQHRQELEENKRTQD